MKNAKNATTKSKKKPEQLQAPGFERKSIPAIEKACIALRETRESRMELVALEAEQQAALADVMAKEGVTVFKFHLDDQELTAKLKTAAKTKVSISKAKSLKSEDE